MKEAEEVYRNRFLNAPVGMVRTDAIIKVNGIAVQLCGGDESQVLHHRPGDALEGSHSYERGCGYSADCPFCPLCRGMEDLIAGSGGRIHNTEVQLSLVRGDEQQLVWLEVRADTMVFSGKRAVCVALVGQLTPGQ